jgi:hypothetical protein
MIPWLAMNKRLVHLWDFHHMIQNSHMHIQVYNNRIDQLP